MKVGKIIFELFWIFLIGSIVGFFLEGIYFWWNVGRWESHSTVIFGYFCTVYGLGAMAIYLICRKLEHKGIVWKGILFAGVATLVEYLVATVQERTFGTASWDYSGMPFHIGKKICLKASITWGVLGVIFCILFYPSLRNWLDKIYNRKMQWLTGMLMLLFLADAIFSWKAVERWKERYDGQRADTVMDEWLDYHYHDNRMQKEYPNMFFVKE